MNKSIFLVRAKTNTDYEHKNKDFSQKNTSHGRIVVYFIMFISYIVPNVKTIFPHRNRIVLGSLYHVFVLIQCEELK